MKKNITVTLPLDEATAIFDALAWAYRLDEPFNLTEDEQRAWWPQLLATFDNERDAIRTAMYRIDDALTTAEQRTLWVWLRHARGSASRTLRDIYSRNGG